MNDMPTTTQSNDFANAVRTNKKVYRMPALKPDLVLQKKSAKLKNKGLVPYVNLDYWCLTCGNKSGKSHPETSYCFICDTDNWQSRRNDC